MKRIVALLAALLVLSAFSAGAETDFIWERDAVFTGMKNCSWNQGYAPVIEGDVLTLHFPLSAPRAAGKITLSLVCPGASPFQAAALSGAFSAGEDGLYRCKLEGRLLKNRVSGDYPAVITAVGRDAAGNALQGEFSLLLRIRDGQAPASVSPALTNPQAELTVGEEGALTLRVENPSANQEMTGLTLIVTDPAGEVLPANSDTLIIGSLLPGESRECVYPLVTLASAAVGPHPLRVSLAWQTFAHQGVWTEQFTLPVVQEMRLAQGGLQMPASVIQGEVLNISLPLMNMGRGELRNVLATLRLPGVAVEQSVLVGGIAPGETATAKLGAMIGSAAEEGDYTGTLEIAYEDAWGNAASMETPLSLAVEPAPRAPAAQDSGAEEAAAAERPAWLLPLLGGGCGALLLALIFQGAILRRKLRRLEDARL